MSEEAISCIKTVKAFSTEHVEMERFNKANDQAYDLGMKVAWINGFFDALVKACLQGVMAMIIYIGALLVENGEL